jgi:Toprim domain
MVRDASELARRLAREAEAVCRHYLSNGRREGRYWLVGDVENTPGRSLFVRLYESPKRPAGKWTDAATGEHGDLLDVIRASLGPCDFRDVANEARRFLDLPRSGPEPAQKPARPAVQGGSREAARRLFAISRPTDGTLVELYLRRRGIAELHHAGSLRYQPRCYYHGLCENSPPEIWPAMIACVTDLDGMITGVHRTWLDPDGFDPKRLGKAPIDTPRRAMGDLLGNAVRFGMANDVLIAGEGLETMLSLRCVLPTMPMAAALSANHLVALMLPSTLRRLYIACDADAAGTGAAMALTSRAEEAGVEAFPLSSRLGDFNEDLRQLGLDEVRATMLVQLLPEDVARFLPRVATDTG